MKTVKKGDAIKRVRDGEASGMIKAGWGYCSKAEFKKLGIKAEIIVEEVVVKKSSSKNKRDQKEKRRLARQEQKDKAQPTKA